MSGKTSGWALTLAVIGACALPLVTIAGVANASTPNEDEPGWNCTTMGNHQCGPATADVNGVVGIYRVPAGELIVWSDRSAQYIPMPNDCSSGYRGESDEDPTVIKCPT